MTPAVAIVGAGPVGLSAAILCARSGLDAVVIEKHPSTAIHPKARGVTIRTMELFRQWGVDDDVRRSGVPPETRKGVTFASTLSAEDHSYIRIEDEAKTRRFSPTTGAGCPQDHLERVLAAKAASYPTNQLCFGETLVAITNTAEHAELETIVQSTGESRRRTARWVVGADGANSTVRALIGARLDGPADLSHNMNILFEADLRPLVEDRPSRLYWIADPPRVTGVLAPVRGYERWLLNVVFDPTQHRSEDFDAVRCAELARRAIGDDRIDVSIISASPWTAAAQTATTWRRERIFLAGDAAHLMPPYGGFGMNTGVQDVHNLIWKLAAVEHGWGGAALLDSYEGERRPVAEWTIEQAMKRMATLGASKPNVDGRVLGGSADERVDGIVFGYTYESDVVAPDGTPAAVVHDAASDYVPSGRPGGRAPHVPISFAGDARVVSTIDLFEDSFVALVGSTGRHLEAHLRCAAEQLRIPLSIWVDGVDFAHDGEFPAIYGIGGGGAAIVRPDGFVSARLRPTAGLDETRDAILTSAGRAR